MIPRIDLGLILVLIWGDADLQRFRPPGWKICLIRGIPCRIATPGQIRYKMYEFVPYLTGRGYLAGYARFRLLICGLGQFGHDLGNFYVETRSSSAFDSAKGFAHVL